MKKPIDEYTDEYTRAPIWDQRKYNGENTLVFESKNLKTIHHKHYKCVGGNIQTTSEVFKRLLGCAMWHMYLNGKSVWCCGIDRSGMTDKGIFRVWERKIPIPITITDEDKIRIEIVNIAYMGELPAGHGITVYLNGYIRNCGCDYCMGKL
jgi:hypothetical protein